MKKQNKIVEERIDAAKNYIESKLNKKTNTGNIKKMILRKKFFGKSYKKMNDL
jgi:hypothetical protein